MAISVIRTLILYIVMMVSMRVMGKRQLGELEPAELVVAVLISDLAATPLQDPGTPLIYGLAPVLTLLFCEVMVSASVLKSRFVRRIVTGTPSVIIENGKLCEREMRVNRYTIDELMEHLRKKQILDIATVKYAILETDGTLSTILYDAESPSTPKQLSLTVRETGVPLVVVSDGEVVTDSLKLLGFNRNWLDGKLRELGYRAPAEVFLMTADREGRVYAALRELS